MNTRNPRSTVGTITEIYDYLKLLFARIGKTYSPVSGKEVSSDTVTDVVDTILKEKDDTKVMISCPLIKHAERTWEQELNVLLGKGYTRIIIDRQMTFIEDVLTEIKPIESAKSLEILIDRLVVNQEEETQFRLSDSTQTAFFEGEGTCLVTIPGKEAQRFSDKFELDGIKFEHPCSRSYYMNLLILLELSL